MATQRDRGSGTGGERSLRATTADRERVLTELSDATARGQLDLGEFDERSAAAWSAPTRTDLADLLGDIVVDPMAVVLGDGHRAPLRREDRRSTDLAPVEAPASVSGSADARITGSPGCAWTVAVLSGAEKKGEWACGRSHRVMTVMGGALVDLREAVFEAPETVITVTAVMGGVQVLVPEDVRVVEHGVGLMGGFGSGRARSVTRSSRDLPADAPVVRVRGVAVMGGVEVKRVPRRRKQLPAS